MKSAGVSIQLISLASRELGEEIQGSKGALVSIQLISLASREIPMREKIATDGIGFHSINFSSE